ncbi:hypothetical protein [Streptomyces sp. NPDC006285]|uniref:hypothetical protein n=1 Tax=Streptomyces sp. NPDC006285 TaxID=3364742 RepID=UPI00367B075F
MTETKGAWSLLVGMTLLWLGVAWDGQWHVDVGPDTFFTAPHLMFYAGSGLIGLTSLAVVLTTTRRGETPADGIVHITRFRAPVAFLVSGLGAAGHLVYGATDLWWHTVYGFDILELTPSHIGLQLAMQTESAGVALAFLTLRARPAGRWGLAAAGALFMASAEISFDGEILGVPVSLLGVGGATAWVIGLVVGAGLGWRWLAATGAAFLALLGATMFFPPFATRVYADAIDLRLRDNAVNESIVGTAMPYLLPLIFAFAAGAVWLARRRNLLPRWAMLSVGAVAAPAVAVQSALFGRSAEGTPLFPLFLTVLAGAGLCWFGWQNAALLRAPRPEAAR